MNGSFRLAWRHLAFHRGRSAILVAAIALTLLVPFGVEGLVATLGRAIDTRAASTPLVLGARGSRFDLVLNALSFRGRVPDPLPLGAVEDLSQAGFGTVIPILARDTARRAPLVGTTPDYFELRGLTARKGSLPALLGECVLGAELAERFDLGPGDHILSDSNELYAIDASYPLRMRIVGVLGANHTADDQAVFASLETVWIAEGIGHGHADVQDVSPDRVISRTDTDVKLDSGVREYQEVTPENLASFHFHVEHDQLPLTAAIVVPRDDRARTMLKGRYRVAEGQQLLEPVAVVEEVTGFVMRLKAFFDANVLLVLAATVVFLGLVVLLSVRVRQREFETLSRIGCARATVVRIVGLEFGLIVVAAIACAAIIAFAGVALLRALLDLPV